MDYAAHTKAISRDSQTIGLHVVALWTAVALAVSLLLGGAPGYWDGVHSVMPPGSEDGLRFPTPPGFNPPEAELAVPVDLEIDEEPTSAQPLADRNSPLRGAPAWVWDLPDDDPRKIAAGADWDVVADVNRQSGMAIMEWAGKIIPDSEYWNGLCPRWTNDPEWGGVGP